MTRPSYAEVHRRLLALADPRRAESASRYFKTGPGQYGEGDKFLGIPVPVLRGVVREYAALPLPAVLKLLKSPWHEERAVAALMLVRRYDKGGSAERERIYRLYLDSLTWINNWDLVDCSAASIVGRHLAGRGRFPLTRMARSEHLWTRRVAVIATFHQIRQGNFDDILFLAPRLLDDKADLIHKAVGWMLREGGIATGPCSRTFSTPTPPGCREPCFGMRLRSCRRHGASTTYFFRLARALSNASLSFGSSPRSVGS